MPPTNKEAILMVQAKVGYALYRRAHEDQHIINISDRHLALSIEATIHMLADFSNLPAPPALTPALKTLNPWPESVDGWDYFEKWEEHARLSCVEMFLELDALQARADWREVPFVTGMVAERLNEIKSCHEKVKEYRLARRKMGRVDNREEIGNWLRTFRDVDVEEAFTEEQVRSQELLWLARGLEPVPSRFTYIPLTEGEMMGSNMAFERRYAQLALESFLEALGDEELYRVEDLGGTLLIPASNDSCSEDFFTACEKSDKFEDDFDDGASIHSVEIDRSQPFSWVATPASSFSGGSNSDFTPFNQSEYIAKAGLPPYLTEVGMPYQSSHGPQNSLSHAQASSFESAAEPSLFSGMESAGVSKTSESVGGKFVEAEVKKANKTSESVGGKFVEAQVKKANKVAKRERRERKGAKRGIVHKQGGHLEDQSKNPFETIPLLKPLTWE